MIKLQDKVDNLRIVPVVEKSFHGPVVQARRRNEVKKIILDPLSVVLKTKCRKLFP